MMMMVSVVKLSVCVCVLSILLALASAAKEEPKRDKRTVDILLRGAADLFGYDVVRRVSAPTFRQAQSTPRPTFFPPPVAQQLPSGSYSRVILALGQQQQEQQQQLQRRIEQSLQVPPLQQLQITHQQQSGPQQQPQQQTSAVINIPQNGALSARAESLSFPGGGLLPLLQVPATQGAQGVSLLSALQGVPQVLPLAPLTVQSAALQLSSQQQQQAPQQASSSQTTQPAQQQAAPAAPAQQQASQSQAAAQNPSVNGNNQANSIGIPLRLVAIGPNEAFTSNGQLQNPAQGENAAQQAQAPSQTPATAAPVPAAPANSASAQEAPQSSQTPTGNGFSIVFDQGPTRWNLFNLPRQESVRRSLNLNLNWNRNVEPAPPAQFQLVPVAAETTPTPPNSQAQQVTSNQIPVPPQQSQQQQQQPPAPTPTAENFDITTQAQNPNSQFNRYYNIPENFEGKTSAQRQNDANQNFRDSVRRFWEGNSWNSDNPSSNRRANLQEELRPRFEEYNLEANTEELNSPESEQLIDENNEVISNEDNRREELTEGNEENRTRGRRFRLNSDRLDEESRESADTPKYRRRNKIRRIRKVKKSFDDNDGNKSSPYKAYKREKKSVDVENSDNQVKNDYREFMSPIIEED